MKSNMKTKRQLISLILLAAFAALGGRGFAQSTPSGYTFTGSYPSPETVQKAYDDADLNRAIQAYRVFYPTVSGATIFKGNAKIGVIPNKSFGTLDTQPKHVGYTLNSDTPYAPLLLDLTDGPMVIESPPNVLGFVDDFWFHFVTDMGNAGRDQGKGGKYLILPPDYKGQEPEGYLVSRSATYGNWFIMRGFLVKGDPKPAVASFKQHMRLYPLAQAANPPATTFINASGKVFNTIHAMDFSFYEEVNKVVQEEPNAAIDPETLGLLASIGIAKGKPFAPDARLKKILVEAANVGNATTRTLMYRSRDKERFIHPDSGWVSPPPPYTFEREGIRLLDTRSSLFFYGTGVTPAMVMKMVGVGSQYAFTFTDAKQQPLDGGKTYRLHLPPNIPAKDFWSPVVYDNQTRSMIQTDQQFPSIGSQKADIAINADTSVDVYFGPKPPPGKESNWVQTWSGKGWNVILCLYGPLQPWFDKTWRPGEIEEMQ
jgi:hypothetical protein